MASSSSAVNGSSKNYESKQLVDQIILHGSIPRVVIPIDDIQDAVPAGYANGEKEIRCKLAALYRLIDHFGWSQSIYNHITVRVSKEDEHFLLNPFGLLYHEITSSSLVKVDVKGNTIDGGSTHFGVNIPGFILHSAIHSARPDAKCVVHVHHAACVAVSAMKCGFLPVSQESVIIGNVSYHDFQGVLIDPSEREMIIKNLGSNSVMFLRNHGLVVVGRTVEEAFTAAYHVILACEAQVRMMSVGLDNLIIISEQARIRSAEIVRRGMEMIAAKAKAGSTKDSNGEPTEVNWGIGEMEFEAYMRTLDKAGYRTGYPYRLPSVRKAH